jgi:hypothetical protein
LTRVSADYVDYAYEEQVERWADQLRAEYESDPALSWMPNPPATGLYFYLDDTRLGEMYQTLQSDVKTAAETATTELESEARAAINAGAASGAAATRKLLIQSIQRLPTPDTAGRQAEWLTRAYRMFDLALRVNHDRLIETWRSEHAMALLSQRGVHLTPEQRIALAEGEACLIEQQLRSRNQPLLFHGEFNITAYSNDSVQFSFNAGANDFSQLSAKGFGTLKSFDGAIKPCIKQHLGCRRHGNILGVVWDIKRSGSKVEVGFVPLAAW